MADSTKKNNYEVSVSLVDGVSKKGNAYTALEVRVGDYRQLLFPSPIERSYIEHVLNSNNSIDKTE